MIRQTSSLRLTPWAAQALSLAEEKAIAERAVDLHCRMTVNAKTPGGSWRIYITSWATDNLGPIHAYEKNDSIGHLADCLDVALDEYARLFAYSADELVLIANQSGQAVSRA